MSTNNQHVRKNIKIPKESSIKTIRWLREKLETKQALLEKHNKRIQKLEKELANQKKTKKSGERIASRQANLPRSRAHIRASAAAVTTDNEPSKPNRSKNNQNTNPQI